VAVTQVTAPDGAKGSLVLRSTGITQAALVDGSFVSGSIDRLRDVVNDDDWEELEIVGLPVPKGRLAGYEDRGQGLVEARRTRRRPPPSACAAAGHRSGGGR
jgi:hypothetical protein